MTHLLLPNKKHADPKYGRKVSKGVSGIANNDMIEEQRCFPKAGACL